MECKLGYTEKAEEKIGTGFKPAYYYYYDRYYKKIESSLYYTQYNYTYYTYQKTSNDFTYTNTDDYCPI